MARKTLFTIGYEGAALDDFLATLVICDVKQVLDVRDVPLSRKRGFSKRALSEALASRGIAYVHLKDLGDPKPGREAARRHDFATFRKIYNRQLASAEGQTALGSAAKLAATATSCLLCFEREFENCHRTIVANALSKESNFTVKHVGVRVGAANRAKKHEYSEREIAVG